jgi:phosphate transport system protein
MTRTADPMIEELRRKILRMAALAGAILDKANRVVRERDRRLGEQVLSDDLEIDRLDVEIDEVVLRALALQAPVAEDLRTVVAAKAIAIDLERIGDLAKNIAKSGMRLAERSDTRIPERLEPLQAEAVQMLRAALDCFQATDAEAARRVIRADDHVDELQDQLVKALIKEIEAHPELAPQTVDVILIAENLERVADHATNIAEDVILVAEARNVKHAAKLESAT